MHVPKELHQSCAYGFVRQGNIASESAWWRHQYWVPVQKSRGPGPPGPPGFDAYGEQDYVSDHNQ